MLLAASVLSAACQADDSASQRTTERSPSLSPSSESGNSRSDDPVEHSVGEGPLDSLGPQGFRTTLFNVGDEFTNGLVIIFNRSDGPLTIDGVSAELSSGNIDLIDVWVAGPERIDGYFDTEPGFPPDRPALGEIAPVGGFEVPPGPASATEGYELLMGFRVLVPERSAMSAVVVDYHDSDGTSYRGRFISTMAVCPPPIENTEEACPFEQ